MQHTTQCLKQQAQAKEWVQKWPNYCKKCDGSGELRWTENQAPLGSGRIWNEEFEDVCDQCVGHFNCPRCKQTWLAPKYREYQKVSDRLKAVENRLYTFYKPHHWGIALWKYPKPHYKAAYLLEKLIRKIRFAYEDKHPLPEDIVAKCEHCGWDSDDQLPVVDCECYA